MPYFRCFIRGENIAWPDGDSWQLMGCYTTRWVQALNPQRAELKAVSTLRHEPEFQRPEGYNGGPPAKVFVEKFEQVSNLPVKRGRGATWFSMEDQ